MARKFGQKREICIDPLAYNIGLIGESGIGKSTVIKEVCEKLAGDEAILPSILVRKMVMMRLMELCLLKFLIGPRLRSSVMM